ncbi:2,4-dienoyl-CoA reductase-like NADH-dependent reductase (Old Yellow Enzyme family) [Paenibacillus taihuensis]|uniref:2,4-dienoyl-CoA reductase-like NADH-dependent reductase (Old Yellow Enzyme family) n=1 Tax=Paenibacillus taihuensis TaxID=1156355 RepID=A0A3D9SKF5_9BACL|nr:NADH:flavin oxidoreductase/NADH oxidase [Paenibacillus taihuensis]REE94353.1 2,4-dienoyl-CoA reductase-like NADH-dependent reductase (Old Yellow Enzyme family) [Paenibacillus taihuensis]
MDHLFTPFTIKGLELKNRVVMPPMCQYAVKSKDGIVNDWHYIHYVSRAIGGASLIIIEMTDIEPDGRITNFDLGLWSDEQIAPLKRIVDAIHANGAKVGIQIAHAGRKAEDAETPVAPSAIPYDDKSKTPRELTTEETKQMVEKFRLAAERAVKADVDTIEIHGAHGYLIHQFQSAYTNKRTDEYGQDKTRFGRQVIEAVKSVIPDSMPLIMRISAREYVDSGYGLEESIAFSEAYRDAGVDMFHISSGGEGPILAHGRPGTHVAYQVPMAREFKQALHVPVIAVGRLDEPSLANAVVGNDEAELVAVGRGMLRNPYWTLEAAAKLGKEIQYPGVYGLGFGIK